MDDPIEITIRVPRTTVDTLVSRAKREGVTVAVVAQRWLADRELQERTHRNRVVELSKSNSESVGHGLGGYLLDDKERK